MWSCGAYSNIKMRGMGRKIKEEGVEGSIITCKPQQSWRLGLRVA